MKRLLRFSLAAIGIAAACGAAYAVHRYRPDLIPEWVHLPSARSSPDGESPAEADEPPEPAPDDGYCGRIAKSKEPTCRPPWPYIRLKEDETAERIGLKTGRAEARDHVEHLDGNAEIAYADPSFAEVCPRVVGRVASVSAVVGDQVEKGRELAVIDSIDIPIIKANYLGAKSALESAKANFDRQLPLIKNGTIAERVEVDVRTELNRAQANLFSAEQRLRNEGFRDADIEEIARKQDTTSLLRIVSPLAGTVVKRSAVVGQAVQPNTLLFVVADRSTMWAWIDIYEADIDHVKPGQKVRFTISDAGTAAFSGTVDLVDFSVNPTTRTVHVRATLKNTEGRLRANQYGRAAIEISEPHRAVLVPRDAVQNDGMADLVFLPAGPRRFLPRRILTQHAEEPGVVEVIWGLDPGQEVVTTGAFLLKSELLKAQIPAEE